LRGSQITSLTKNPENAVRALQREQKACDKTDMKSIRPYSTSMLVLLLFVAVSCKESPQKQYAKDGVSFTCPKGWKIDKYRKMENGAHLLTIVKGGFSSSGLININWINSEVEPGAWLDAYQKELRKNVIYKNSNLKFGPKHSGQFSYFQTNAIDFEVKLLGIKYYGIIQEFVTKNKSFAILKQQALKDTAENRPGFKTIEASFAVE
jgi:hypothetical protein